MRRSAPLLCIFLVCAAATAAFAQDPSSDDVIPVDNLSVLSSDGASLGLGPGPDPSANPGATLTVPIWAYNIVDYLGNLRTGTIVGRSPFTRGATTTSVPVVIIPLIINFSSATTGALILTADPTSADDGCLGTGAPPGTTALAMTQQSPIFVPIPTVWGGTNLGNVTFPDAFQRASFWSNVQNNQAYHLAFNPVTTVAPQVLNFSASTTTAAVFGFNNPAAQCGTNAPPTNAHARIGVVAFAAIDAQLRAIITNLGIQPTQFPLFMIYKSVISNGAANNINNCCILGYHQSLGPNVSNPGQTYGIAEYDTGTVFGGTADISVLSHEVMEWINDPSGRNPTGPWGHIGQVGGCQGNFETGDPLSGTLMPAVQGTNAVTYHEQEQAFWSWFFVGQGNGTGVNGWLTSNGKYTNGHGARLNCVSNNNTTGGTFGDGLIDP